MDKSIKYKYRCRPGYGSDRLLLEFVGGILNKAFRADLFNAIKEISPKLTGCEDLWMNDEALNTANSDLG